MFLFRFVYFSSIRFFFRDVLVVYFFCCRFDVFRVFDVFLRDVILFGLVFFSIVWDFIVLVWVDLSRAGGY